MDLERVYDPPKGTDSSAPGRIATEHSQGTISSADARNCIVTTAYNNAFEDTIRPDNAVLIGGSHRSFPADASTIEQSERAAGSSHQSRKDDANALETQVSYVLEVALLTSMTLTIHYLKPARNLQDRGPVRSSCKWSPATEGDLHLDQVEKTNHTLWTDQSGIRSSRSLDKISWTDKAGGLAFR